MVASATQFFLPLSIASLKKSCQFVDSAILISFSFLFFFFFILTVLSQVKAPKLTSTRTWSARMSSKNSMHEQHSIESANGSQRYSGGPKNCFRRAHISVEELSRIWQKIGASGQKSIWWSKKRSRLSSARNPSAQCGLCQPMTVIWNSEKDVSDRSRTVFWAVSLILLNAFVSSCGMHEPRTSLHRQCTYGASPPSLG